MRSLLALDRFVMVLGLTSIACSSDTQSSSTTTSGPAPEIAASSEGPASTPEPEGPSERPGDAVALAEGGSFVCALQRAGTVACWGDNKLGQLGQDHLDDVTGAVLVQGLDDAVAIAAGYGTACAARRSGSVRCWGSGNLGALGTGKDADHRGFVDVPGVRDATGLFSDGSYTFCAITPSGTWCWGSVAGIQPVITINSAYDHGPWRLDLEGIRALDLGDGSKFTYLADGSVLAWSLDQGSVVVPGIVEANSDFQCDCLAHDSGEVICSPKDEDDKVIASLRGARQLFHYSTLVAGLLPDGTLAGETLKAKQRQPTFVDAHDLVAITTGVQSTIHGIRRDGRVFVWENDGSETYVPREIVLPAPSALGSVSAAPSLPEGDIPSWCSIETKIVSPVDVGPLADVVSKALGPDEREHAALCSSLGIDVGSADCPASGPWFVQQSNSEIALVVPLGAGQFGRIPELAEYVGGTEEMSVSAGSQIRSSSPVDAWLLMNDGEMVCDDAGEDELCGMSSTYDKHIVVTGLAGGTFLVTRATIDLNDGGKEGGLPARAAISGDMLDVWACGGHTRMPLPAGARAMEGSVAPQPSPVEPSAVTPSAVTPSTVSPTLPAASADEAAAAGKRCGEGWSKFQAGEVAAAKLEIDEALTVLERARDEKGQRSLGACLYNRGRIAEQEGKVAEARELYRRSLTARPNDTVSARLDSLN